MKFHLTQELLDTIDQYIKGELEGKKLSNFENKLKENDDLREEVMIQKQLFNAIQDKDSSDIFTDDEVNELKTKINSPAYQDISNKIRNIGSEYIQDPVPNKKPIWIRFKRLIPAAAAIFVLVVISTIYFTSLNPSMDQYYYDNANWESELISFSEKGDAKNAFTKAENLFKAKEFTQAVQAFENIRPEDELYPYSLMYLGAAHSNLNQDQQALQAFNKLATMSQFEESSKGLWYAALIHLKQKDKKKAISTLKEVVKDSNNYNYSKALDIIDVLEK